MIAEAMTSLKAASDIAKVLYDAKLSADVREQIGSLKGLIFDAREQAFAAQDELALVKA